MDAHEESSRSEELARIYWQTLAEIEALLRPPADDDAEPVAA